MLIRISEDTSINPEYIINLYVRQDDKPQTTQKGKDHYQSVPTNKWMVVAKMIDGSFYTIGLSDTKGEAERFYSYFLETANIHKTMDIAPEAYLKTLDWIKDSQNQQKPE